MQGLGFIHDMMDLKILILFVLSKAAYPATSQQIYEMCLQDGSVSYFDVCAAIPEMVASGHLSETDGRYVITEKGKADGACTQDGIAYTVRTGAENAVERFNRSIHRSSFVKTKTTACDNGEYIVRMTLDNEAGNLISVELPAPNQRQALRVEELLQKKAENIYNLTISELFEEDW